MDHLHMLEQNNPAAIRNHNKMNEQVDAWIRAHGNEHRSGGVITIPTVVHVVYRTSIQNISQAQIQSQIDALNEDYSKTNADASNVPAAWQGIAADAQIQFCLAQRDPQGMPHTGITRTATQETSFGLDDQVKYTSQGGHDAWPRNEYLNIWVCGLGGGLLGYAQFPGQPAATDGVVIGYNYFGRTGTVSAPFNKGRTTTHEVGHWLGLYHIWGDDGGACNGSDQVNDTPNQASETYGCFAAGSVRTDNCSPSAPGYMWMNYMDYTDDACMYMFTAGQTARMNSVLNTSRAALQNSQGCVPVALQPNDAGVTGITAPTGSICGTAVTPVITLYNWGANALTSVTINWTIDGGAVNTYNWTGNLASLGTTTVTLTSTPVGVGNHTINIYTTMPNGQADGNTTNDAQSGSFTMTSAQTAIATPYAQGFENSTFPPTGWSISNPDNDMTWERKAGTGYNSTGSAWVNNYDYNADGEIDDLVLPTLDLSSLSSPTMTFDMAYVLYSQTGYSDTLRVLVSSDCGTTWLTPYNKSGQNLTTVTPYYQNSAFTPSNANQWRNETVNLAAFAGQSSVIIKFRNITQYENNLYIDNVNITGVVAAEEGDLDRAVNLYPNPGTGHFTVEVNMNASTDLDLEVYSSVGKRVFATHRAAFIKGRIDMDLATQAAGVYYVRVKAGEATITKKLVKM